MRKLHNACKEVEWIITNQIVLLDQVLCYRSLGFPPPHHKLTPSRKPELLFTRMLKVLKKNCLFKILLFTSEYGTSHRWNNLIVSTRLTQRSQSSGTENDLVAFLLQRLQVWFSLFLKHFPQCCLSIYSSTSVTFADVSHRLNIPQVTLKDLLSLG